MSLNGRPLLARLIERLKPLDIEMMVCTGEGNNQIVGFCQENKVPYIRAFEDDVMSRLILAANLTDHRDLIRVTADNPLTDPDILQLLVKIHIQNKNDYTYIEGPPPGTRCEIINTEALRALRDKTLDPELQENMTPALKTMGKVQKVPCPVEWLSKTRLTIDTLVDLQRVRKIYTHFKGAPPGLTDLIKWINSTGYLETGPLSLSRK